MKSIKLDKKIIQTYSLPTAQSQEKGSIWEREIHFGAAISLKERQQLFHLLSILLSSGLGILDALAVILDQMKKKRLRVIISDIYRSLEAGDSFSASLQKQQKYFSTFEIKTAQMGEQTGQMADVLLRLSELYEKRIHLKRKLMQALSYPIAVILIAGLVLSFMIAFVVPMFQDVFDRFDSALPPITQTILDLSELVTENGLIILLGIASLSGLILFIRKKAWFQKAVSHLILNTPIMGNIILKLHLARFCFTLSLLLKARVNLDQALQLLHQITTFYPLKHALAAVRKQVIEGKTIYEAFSAHQIFPLYFTQIIKVGEKTASLEKLTEKLGKSLEEESGAGISQLTQFMEPVLIIILGLMVAIILIAMYLPMFELSSAIG